MAPLADPYNRIIGLLRLVSGSDVWPPVSPELEFIQLTRNHAEFAEKLRRFGLEDAANVVSANARYVGLRWLALGRKHQDAARRELQSGSDRAALSRAYYAAYNASKSVRYIVAGSVSLKGDDHGEASDLPDDFPNVDRWSEAITRLYEHRLRADYDNWRSTTSEMTLSAREAVDLATGFLEAANDYLLKQFEAKQ